MTMYVSYSTEMINFVQVTKYQNRAFVFVTL